MACPFFMPVSRLDEGNWVHAPRLPLGDFYRGVCRSQASESFDPPESSQRDLCNYGYARGRCERFPADSPGDAVRFSVITDEGVGDEGGRLRLVYIVEKDHAPADHGTVESRTEQIQSLSLRENDVMSGQARAFLESYLRRKQLG